MNSKNTDTSNAYIRGGHWCGREGEVISHGDELEIRVLPDGPTVTLSRDAVRLL